MKRFVVLTAAALTAASAIVGTASAQTANTGDYARSALERIAPNANIAALSNAEAVAVYQVVQTENGAANAKARAQAMIANYAQ
ncbi:MULTISPECIES: hypothetical protein [Salipiger]|uniref:DUF4148 domain-containing protein n=1 Tax=Salipiger profundus TaxID=1229727 RepID=A0A1U7D5B9_9RHOB|nr:MULTISPECIES: hypothetical protein [Salipiger]APX23298.1 hypothetical protein Ga0080559_TMP2502 [Salipiger profundus]GGA29592.1 hypothetical protein GCM10011326_46930 [Salipiger profundus]SFD47674.1 hypothetical protein SAMN05444415_11198 [Salipiger profundus]